jgi:hypothetical protein
MPMALSGTFDGWVRVSLKLPEYFWASCECDGEQAISRAAADKTTGARKFIWKSQLCYFKDLNVKTIAAVSRRSGGETRHYSDECSPP